jgi:DNA-binding NtrC family response regulator
MNNEKTIFGVDDDHLNRLLLTAFVKKNAITTDFVCFSNVAEIKDYIERNGEPDLIISDYQMEPGDENGADFSKWLIGRKFRKFIIWTDSVSRFNEEVGFREEMIEVCEKDDWSKLKGLIYRYAN